MFEAHTDTRQADRFDLVITLNDLAIGVWFAVGCLFFLGDASSQTAIWMFFFGSLQMIAGPLLRLCRRRRHPPEVPVQETGA